MKVIIDKSFDVFKEEKETRYDRRREALSIYINSFPRFKRDDSVFEKTKKEKNKLKKFKYAYKHKND